MRAKKTVQLRTVFSGLDSNQLKELREQFNAQYRETISNLKAEEIKKLESFVDSLPLYRSWNREVRNVVSLRRWALTPQDREKLDSINHAINRAFIDLERLKISTAAYARKENLPNSKFFKTTLKRMKKWQGTDDSGSIFVK